MKLNRDKIKEAVSGACLQAFSQRKTINDMLAIGFMTMIDSICDEIEFNAEPQPKVKKVA